MHLTPFHERFPKIGKDEYRSVTLLDGGEFIPPGSYAFVECYCPDVKCDCRRVMLVVIEAESGKPMASIAFGFNRQEPLAGPFLDPLNPQSPCASEFLDLARDLVLSDRHYVARLEKHYRMFKASLRGELVGEGAKLTPGEVQERIAKRKARKRLIQRFHDRNKNIAYSKS